jgi:hypothetical protein
MCHLQALNAVITAAWNSYNSIPVPPRYGPMPILWFGDLDAYCKSPCRIITVGKNPSHLEFPEGCTYERFPAAANNASPLNLSGIPAYIQALSGYFTNCLPGGNPTAYWSWFRGFDSALKGFNAGYGYNGSTPTNTAIHTDLLSPVATCPVWTDLSTNTASTLITQGSQVWLDLIQALEPHLVLLSFGSGYLQHIPGNLAGPTNWKDIYTISVTKTGKPRRKPFKIYHQGARLPNGHMFDLLFAIGAQTPFGDISSRQAADIGTDTGVRNALTAKHC